MSSTGTASGGSISQDNMNDIAEVIRTDPSVRQAFFDIATQRDSALGQQLTQSLRLLDTVTRTAGPQGVRGQLTTEEKEAIQRLTDLGFEKKKASDRNEERATKYLRNGGSEKSMDLNNAKAITLEIGKLISDNPSFRQGLHEFIAQNKPSLAQQMKENPALFEAALQSIGDGTEMSNKEFLEYINEFIRRSSMEIFFRDKPAYIQELAEKATQLKNDQATPLAQPDLLLKVIKVTLHQQVIYCDDSSSMQREGRWDAQIQLIKRITSITTHILPESDGIGLRFLNQDVDNSDKLSLENIGNIMQNMSWQRKGDTPIGTHLKSKILEPPAYSKLQSRTLERPLLISVITDGMPAPEKEDVLVEAIKECGVRLEQAKYPRGSVKFIIGQIGAGKALATFLQGIGNNKDVKDMVFVTSDQLDERVSAFKEREDDLDRWLIETIPAY